MKLVRFPISQASESTLRSCYAGRILKLEADNGSIVATVVTEGTRERRTFRCLQFGGDLPPELAKNFDQSYIDTVQVHPGFTFSVFEIREA